MNHTPGPWITKPTASLGPQWAVYTELAGTDIAIVYDHGNTEANARLIAASPELLDAAKSAVWKLAMFRLPRGQDIEMYLEPLRAAIDRAEGRSV